MEWFELYDIAERYMELINPSSPEKVLRIGEIMGMNKDTRIIDFGCGFGEPLALWGKRFGISGIGVDFRPHAVQRARQKMIDHGLGKRIEIVESKGAEYEFERHTFDIASCMGATFIWDGFRPTICALREAIKPHGKILIGEPYWLKNPAPVPADFIERESVYFEHQLLDIAADEGFDFYYMIRSSDDDWTNYEADNWRGLNAWLTDNPDHPDREQVIEWLRKSQVDYLKWGREYLGWAMYVLTPRIEE